MTQDQHTILELHRELDRLRQLERNAATTASRPSGYPYLTDRGRGRYKGTMPWNGHRMLADIKGKGRDPGPPNNDPGGSSRGGNDPPGGGPWPLDTLQQRSQPWD